MVSVRKIPIFTGLHDISSRCSPPQPGPLHPVTPLSATTGTHDDGVTPLVPYYPWSVKRIVCQSSNSTVFIMIVKDHL